MHVQPCQHINILSLQPLIGSKAAADLVQLCRIPPSSFSEKGSHRHNSSFQFRQLTWSKPHSKGHWFTSRIVALKYQEFSTLSTKPTGQNESVVVWHMRTVKSAAAQISQLFCTRPVSICCTLISGAFRPCP